MIGFVQDDRYIKRRGKITDIEDITLPVLGYPMRIRCNGKVYSLRTSQAMRGGPLGTYSLEGRPGQLTDIYTLRSLARNTTKKHAKNIGNLTAAEWFYPGQANDRRAMRRRLAI